MKSKSTIILIVAVVFILCVGVACLCVYLIGKNIKDLDISNHSDEEINNQTLDNLSEDNIEQEEDVDEDREPQRYAVVVSGASHDATHYEWYRYSTREAYDLLLENDYTDENIYFLFENASEKDTDFESSYENFVNVIYDLQDITTSQDQIVFFLIGHGMFDGTNSYFELTNDSISDMDFAELVASLKRDRLIVVLSPCNTGGFINDLSGSDTIIVTSTRADESNRAAFIEPYLSAFRGDGDENGDGKVSFAEAFNYATEDVRKQYDRNGWGTVTEHPQLDDNADGISHEAPVPSGGDGRLAGETYL